jgi:phosphoglycolate phosphatase-like HAD superfamily hydrolase
MKSGLIAGWRIADLICSKSLVFWDFDGVIKDSIEAKARAFEALFLPYGVGIARRVREHHEQNGGVSRFEKIPLYLDWAGVPVSAALVNDLCQKFSEQVLQEVLGAPWVGGVSDYLLEHCERQVFILVTATPQDEIEYIIERLGINQCFCEVYGAPLGKSEALGDVIRRHKIEREEMLMVGDTRIDLEAALNNAIPFLLRKTAQNEDLQASYDGPMFEDFMP